MSISRVPVAILTSTFDAGGTERQMVELIRGLAESYDVHAVCFAARGPWLSTVRDSARSISEFTNIGFGRAETWRHVQRFSDWCREKSIQLVLTSDFYTNVFGLTGAAWAGVPVRIGGRREINTDKTLAKLALQRAAYSTAHRIVANSQAAAARLRAEGVSPRRIAVVPNGIDALAFATARQIRPVRRAVTVANLRAEKGHDVLLDAIAASTAVLSDLEFQFVGSGPCRAALEDSAKQRGLAGRVRFLGERTDIPAILADADFFVLPSRTEAFPNSLMEAMAAGLPVVASRVGGIGELVEHGVSGLLVPPGDSRALANAIAALAGDPQGAAAMGRAARESIATRYSLATMVGGFSQLFQAELQRRRSRALNSASAKLAAPR